MLPKTRAPDTIPGVGKSSKKAAGQWPGVLKAWRTKRGFTQKQAAKFLGVALKTYEHWERAIARPTILSVGRLESILLAKLDEKDARQPEGSDK
jgi:transcriptional regulator with XRE-family HTH domain